MANLYFGINLVTVNASPRRAERQAEEDMKFTMSRFVVVNLLLWAVITLERAFVVFL